MKKIIGMLLVVAISIISFTNISKAATIAPQFDATYNNNKGILYANGNSIIIKEDENHLTKAYWNGGSQELPQTATVVGGRK